MEEFGYLGTKADERVTCSGEIRVVECKKVIVTMKALINKKNTVVEVILGIHEGVSLGINPAVWK